MGPYVVYYHEDGWHYDQGYYVQMVRQPLPDGRLLIVDLWQFPEALQPVILRVTTEGNVRAFGAIKDVSILPQEVVLLAEQR